MPFSACGENCAVKCRVALWQSRRPRLMSVPFFWRQSPQRMPCLSLDLQRDFWEIVHGILKNCIVVYHEDGDKKFRHDKQCFINMVLENLFWGQMLGFRLSEIELKESGPGHPAILSFFYSKDWKGQLIQHNINISFVVAQDDIFFVLQVIRNSTMCCTCSTQLNVLSQWNRHKTYHSIICVLNKYPLWPWHIYFEG